MLCGTAVAGVAGCHAAAPTVAAAEVQAVATQTRFDEVADRRFEITITDTGRQPYTVSSVRLDSPGFAPTAATARDDLFAPAITYDLPATYGPARCDAQVEPAMAVVVLHREGAPAGAVRVPLLSPDGLLRQLHDGECAARELGRQVQVDLVGLTPAGRGVLHGQLHLRRGSWPGPVAAVELRDSVLYAFTVTLPARLEAGVASLDVPVDVRPATCAPHRIADAKQPFLFPLFLSLGGAPAREVDLPTTGSQQAALHDLTVTICAGVTQE